MKDENTKRELFETVPVPKAVANMCIPAIVGSLVMMLYNLADTYFVGALNDPIESSAVTLAAPALLAFNAINNLFGVGSSSLMSRSLGSGDYDTTRKAATLSLYGAAACGLLISLLSAAFRTPLIRLLGADAQTFDASSRYLFWTVICGAIPSILNVVMSFLIKAEGAAMHATIGTMSGCLLNIILDPFFILPQYLGMGAAGAGLATLISNCFAVGYFLILMAVKKGRTFVTLNPKYIKPTKNLVGQICSVGIPAAIQNLLNVTGQTVLNNFAAAFGPTAVTAIGITHKVIMIPVMISMGVSSGITPLISYNYTSGNHRRLKDVFFFTTKISLVLMVVMAAVYFVFSEGITRFFIEDSQVVSYGRVMLRYASPTVLFLTMDFIAVGVFQALGMGRKSLYFAIMRKVILEIPALFLWNSIIPMYGLALAQPTAELVLSVIAVITLKKIFASFDDVSGKRIR